MLPKISKRRVNWQPVRIFVRIRPILRFERTIKWRNASSLDDCKSSGKLTDLLLEGNTVCVNKLGDSCVSNNQKRTVHVLVVLRQFRHNKFRTPYSPLRKAITPYMYARTIVFPRKQTTTNKDSEVSFVVPFHRSKKRTYRTWTGHKEGT